MMALAPLLAMTLGGTLGSADLSRLLQEQLPGSAGPDSLRWSVSSAWTPVAFPPGTQEVRVRLPEGPARTGMRAATVQFLRDGRVLTSAPAGLRCERVGDALRVLRPVQVGEVLTPEDVQVEHGALPTGERPLSDPGAVVGQRVRRALPAEAFLLPSSLQPVPVVTRGTPLEVRAESNSFVLRFSAQAQQDGAVGEVIRARGPGRGSLLQVRVTGPAQAVLVP